MKQSMKRWHVIIEMVELHVCFLLRFLSLPFLTPFEHWSSFTTGTNISVQQKQIIFAVSIGAIILPEIIAKSHGDSSVCQSRVKVPQLSRLSNVNDPNEWNRSRFKSIDIAISRYPPISLSVTLVIIYLCTQVSSTAKPVWRRRTFTTSLSLSRKNQPISIARHANARKLQNRIDAACFYLALPDFYAIDLGAKKVAKIDKVGLKNMSFQYTFICATRSLSVRVFIWNVEWHLLNVLFMKLKSHFSS